MAILPSYKTGTVTVANGSAVVTGSGTAWATALVTGGLFSCRGQSIPIASVDSETQITLDYAWRGPNASAQAYSISRQTADAVSNVWTADRLAQTARGLPLSAVIPDATGTEADRDALTLGVDDANFIFLRWEDGYALALSRWSGTAWSEWKVIEPAEPEPGAPGTDGVQSSDGSVTDVLAMTVEEYEALPSKNPTAIYYTFNETP